MAGRAEGGKKTQSGPTVDHLGRRIRHAASKPNQWQEAEEKRRESEHKVGDNVAYEVSALELFLLTRENTQFRVAIAYEPYFYVAAALRYEARTAELCGVLSARFAQLEGMRAEAVELEDLETPNHVAGRKRLYVKLSFRTVSDLLSARRELLPVVKGNRPRLEVHRPTEDTASVSDLIECIDEIREYDVPYYMRAAIDMDLRVGAWVEVGPKSQDSDEKRDASDKKTSTSTTTAPLDERVASASLASQFAATWRRDIVEKPTPRVLAFDIECTKAALKFPNAEHDEVFMISYMVDGVGYLIISRTVVAEDIADLEYTPKPKFPGKFTVFNEPDEKALLKKFIRHCRELKPHVYVTYNGDFFDWPFVKRRCQIHDLDVETSLGIGSSDEASGAGPGQQQQAEFRGFAGPVHLDAFAWVKRDSYLPQGSQGLKAVTKCKLGYDPVEVDAEDMVRFAGEEPQTMAEYSVSDAVSTYYLYEVYVNLFIFSLCTVIPNGAEDVLRKGSGTLCEALLLVQAYKANVIAPNKQSEPALVRHEGKVLETETYVGGHVECLESGVFRADIECDFEVDPEAVAKLSSKVERDVKFAVEVEAGGDLKDCVNYAEVCDAIKHKLQALRDTPKFTAKPFIYHLDVAAMYPNIILTNRLQPTAVVGKEDCAACDYNDAARGLCKREMEWTWRGEVNPASAAEVNQMRRQLQYEIVDGQSYHELGEKERADRLKKRLRDYAQKVYKKTREVKEEPRTDVVCMRENAFYVDTVKAFRDRRYEYKALVKTWRKKKLKQEHDPAAFKQCEDKEQLFDSLQLAHKCILNSFYGYVMRKGARWRSMPMAGIVTLTGANLITQARELVEKLGRPLELDTDGIWCMLPCTFPENYELELVNPKTGDVRKVPLSYPCAMLNADVHQNYSNHQYQTLVTQTDPDTGRDSSYYQTSSECSIFFEVDGPYRCMVLPSSTEEGKLLKKRYAVFNHDRTLAELKGFELKRRGELALIKTFQAEIFDQFLEGTTLEECYAHVAAVANQWLDVLDSKGAGLEEADLLDLISEDRAMSREVSEYEGRKMTSLTTARRLADFLGDDMLADKGLQCKLVISSQPRGAPVTDRAVPTAIFAAEPAVRRHYLRKWLKDNSLQGTVREVVDWQYYRERLDGVIRKIVTIPAALQKIPNPVPRVGHPEWLRKVVAQRDDPRKQTKISDHFRKASAKRRKQPPQTILTDSNKRRPNVDLEDLVVSPASASKRRHGLSPVAARVIARASPSSGTSPGPNLGRRELFASSSSSSAKKKNKTQETSAAGGFADDNNERTPRIDGPPKQLKDGFDAWLADRKARWRARRDRRRVKPVAFELAPNKNTTATHGENAPTTKKRGPMGITDMLRQTNEALRGGVWRVLEVRPAEVAGEVHCWVQTELGHLHRVVVTVPRVMYLEVRGEDAAAAKAVVAAGGRRAPHWKPPVPPRHKGNALYELRLPERRFADNERALAAFLAHPGLDAAYELATPSWFRALLTVGHQARVDTAAPRNQHADFDLDDLRLVPDHDAPAPTVRLVFFYHSRCPRTGRAVVAVFFLHRPARRDDDDDGGDGGPADKDARHRPVAVVAVADPRAKRTEKPPPLKRLYDMSARPQVSVGAVVAAEAAGGRLKKLWGSQDDSGDESEEEEEEEEEEDDENEEEAEGAAADTWAPLRVQRSELVKDESSALAVASAALAEYAGERRGATLIAVQSATPAAHLRRSVPVLGDFPNVEMAFHDADADLPALGWRTAAVKRAMERLVACPAWIDRRLATARFANLPVGNLGDDALVRVADVAFARLLRANRHLLWASEAPQPDLGSCADDLDGAAPDTSLPAGLLEDEEAKTIQTSGSIGRHSKTDPHAVTETEDQVDAPGAYRVACVSLTVYGAAVNAVMVSDHLDDDDDAAAVAAVGGCRDAFYLLRTLLGDWFEDVEKLQSEHADDLLEGFYRWLSARTSLLHFPALRRLVVGLMRRVHAKLVAELQRLGMRVVHADFHRLVLATNKHDVASAMDHLNFVCETLGARPVFRFLSLQPTAWYASLLWLDTHNYAGLELIDPNAGCAKADAPPEEDAQAAPKRRQIDDEDEDEDEVVSPEGARPSSPSPMEEDKEDDAEEKRRRAEASNDRFVSSWKLANDLPELATEYLAVIVGSFLHKPLECARRRRRDRERFRDADRAAVATAAKERDDEDARAVVETTARFVEDYAAEKLVAIAAELQRTAFYAPTAALDFVKLLAHVLSLDKTVQDQVLKVRRLSLAKIGVREFAPEAVFRPPAAAVVVKDITCPFCSTCTDLDLSDRNCRVQDGADALAVACAACGRHYDLLDLELRVVEQLHQLSAAYVTSDLRCVKCRRVATGNMAVLCNCSGRYKVDVPRDKLATYLLACAEVARDLHLPYLAEVAAQLQA